MQRIGMMIRDKQDHRVAATGTDLVVLKSDVIDREFGGQYKDIEKNNSKMSAGKSRSALEAGYRAGDNIEINPALKEV